MASCVAALAMTTAAAQTGGIDVVVTDAEGAPLPGATVTISHDTGFVKTMAELTNRRGIVRFPVLRAGKGYSIQVSFPGFNAIRQTDLRVRINTTLVVSTQMIDGFGERVRVAAEREIIDLDKTEKSTKFSESFIADLPVPGRFYQNVLTMAPGVQDADGDGNPNVHGSRSRDFRALISGVSNVDPLTGRWMSRINPNSIEEIEVITAGAGVEFGRAQGGFARIVQKQGSNEHEGVFEFYWNSSKLDGGSTEYDTYQPQLQVSGPLIKDRLWYRGSYSRRDGEDPFDILFGIEIYEKDTETRDAQLTWQVSPRNKLALQYRSDPLDSKNFGVSSVIPPESSISQGRTGQTYSLIWTAPYSPKLLVENTVAWQEIKPSERPSQLGVLNDCVPNSNRPYLREALCTDLSNQLVSGSYNEFSKDRRQRLTVRSQSTIYAGRFWGMDHQFKLGFVVENERYFRRLTRTPSITYEIEHTLGDDFGIALARIAVPASSRSRATGTNWAFYAEDQFKPLDNLTFTLGGRLDREELNSLGREPFDPVAELQAFHDLVAAGVAVSDARKEAFLGYEDFELFQKQMQARLCKDVPPSSIGQCHHLVQISILSAQHKELNRTRRVEDQHLVNNNVSPFFSVAWSPGSTGRTALKATIGRHYNNNPLIIPLQELEPVLSDVENRVNLATLQTKLTGGIVPKISVKTVDRDLKTPYQDELTLSIEQALWPETSLSLTYVDRSFRDQIQDVNINADVGDYGVCTVQSPPGQPFQVLPSPGGGKGSGLMVTDPHTGETYEDTDPGPGDGRLDDCAGETFFAPAVDPFGDTGDIRLDRPDGITDLYVQNPFWGDIFLVGNFNEIDYRAFVLELVRRQYRSWEMNASYTWSRARGDGEDFFQEIGNDPSLRDSVRGYQSYDQRHVVKLNATTITPWGIRLGTTVTWQSGLPYSLLTEGLAFDTKPPSTLPFGGVGARSRQVFFTGARNDQRNDSYWDVDLKATKEFRLGKGVNLQLSAEIFNALNDRTYIVYNPFFERGQQVNGRNEATRRFGRQWQVGMKLAY